MTLSFLSFAAVIGWIPYRIDAPVEAKAPEAFTIWWAPQHGMSKRLGMLGGAPWSPAEQECQSRQCRGGS